MASESGLTYDFSKVDLIIGAGFRVDAYADAGFVVNWQGDRFTVATGADDNNIFVAVNNTSALLTSTHMQSARFLDYVTAWLAIGITRPLSFQDRTGRTFMTAAKSMPRQQPNLTFNNSDNPLAIDIHCANLRGVIGGLN